MSHLMIDTLLLLIVVGVLMVAFVVDLAALVGWLRRWAMTKDRRTSAARRDRFERILMSYVVATGGRLPERVNDLLPAIFAAVPDTNTQEIADAIRWAIRRTKRQDARLERALRNTNATSAPPAQPRLKVVK